METNAFVNTANFLWRLLIYTDFGAVYDKYCQISLRIVLIHITCIHEIIIIYLFIYFSKMIAPQM